MFKPDRVNILHLKNFLIAIMSISVSEEFSWLLKKLLGILYCIII